MNIETALTVLRDRANAENRALIREAAEFLVAHSTELTTRVAVPITPEELADPAWAAIIAGSFTTCVCNESECHAQYLRVIGPALRTTLEAGQTLVLTAGKRVFLRLVGTTHLLQSLEVDAAQGGLVIETSGLEPAAYAITGIAAAIAAVPAEQRTLRARGADGLLVVVTQLEAANPETNEVTVILDKDVETFEVRDTLIEGETFVIEPGKKVFLRKKGAGDADALRAYWVDGERQAFFFEDDPLSPMSQLAALFGGGPRAFGLVDLAEQVVPLPAEKRTLKTDDAQGLPVVLFRLEAVDVATNKVTVVLDQGVEAYDPPAGDIPGLQVIQLGPDDAIGDEAPQV